MPAEAVPEATPAAVPAWDQADAWHEVPAPAPAEIVEALPADLTAQPAAADQYGTPGQHSWDEVAPSGSPVPRLAAPTRVPAVPESPAATESHEEPTSTEMVPGGRRRVPALTAGDEVPAALLRPSTRRQWPGQESWASGDESEHWEEIPLRTTLSDRASSILPGSWRIAVTSLFPYSGTTTLTGVVGLTLAGVRGEPVLGIDLHPGAETPGFVPPTSADSVEIDESRGDNLVSRVGSRGLATVADIARLRGSGAGVPAEETRALISAQRAGSVYDLDVLPVDRPAENGTAGAGDRSLVPVDEPATPAMLHAVLGGLAHAYPLVLMDAPAAAPLTPTALRSADAVILVTLATASDLETTLADLIDPEGALAGVGVRAREPAGRGRLEPGAPDDGTADPAPSGPVVIAAVVSPRRGRPSPRARNATARLARHVDGIVRVPYDPRLDPSRGTPVRIPRLRLATRRAYLRLAAETVDALAAVADSEGDAQEAEAQVTVQIEPTSTVARPTVRPPTELATPNTSTLSHTADADHGQVPGVSFGDLRPGSPPARVSEPDRPGDPSPAGREPR